MSVEFCLVYLSWEIMFYLECGVQIDGYAMLGCLQVPNLSLQAYGKLMEHSVEEEAKRTPELIIWLPKFR